MNKLLSIIAISAMLMSTVASCSSDDASEESKSNEEQVEKKTGYNAVYVSSEDKMVFITLKSDGSVEYCLDKYVMGYGKYEIANNALTISNEYSGYTDELDITDSEDGSIRLKGHIRRYKTTEYSYIDLVLSKSDEALETSLVGEEWKDSGNGGNGGYTIRYSFNTEHTGHWDNRLDASGTLIKQGDFHYIARVVTKYDNDWTLRPRKVAYYHYDNSEEPNVRTRDEENSFDINFWNYEE